MESYSVHLIEQTDILEPEARLAFEWRLLWLRLSFLLTPLLMLVAYGIAAFRPSAFIELAVGLDSAFFCLLIQQAPQFVLRRQLALRLIDLAVAYVVLQVVHTFVGNAYYCAVYLLFVVAAAATHGRRGMYWIGAVAALAVLLGRLQLIAAGVIPYQTRDITDSLFYALLFITTASVTLFLMRKSREAVEAREQALRESEERYRGLFEGATDIVYIHDLEGNFLSFNRAAQERMGYTRDDLPGLNIAAVIAPEHLERARHMIRHKLIKGGATVYEVELIAKDGHRITVEVSSQIIEQQGRPVAIQGIARDITERKALEEQLRYQALHDALTGLPNRALFHDRLAQLITGARRSGSCFALLLLDLDHFKEINDTFGHQHGDVLLQEVGSRIRRTLRESDTAARLGGDEFAIILPGTQHESAIQVAEKLQVALDEPYHLEHQALQVGVSIGITLFPEHGEDGSTLLCHVDMAMYEAKRIRERSSYAVYASEHHRHSRDRLALVGDLRRAIEQDELLLHFQPKVGWEAGRSGHVEALVRWQHPEQGLLPPGRFIPVAEETGLIEPLTRWVLRAAIQQCAAWRSGGLQVGVAVNLSGRTLHDPQLPARIEGLLHRYRLAPSALEVEITESTLMADPVQARRILSQVHELGVRIAIDDFGTGYSSLAYLQQLPVDQIKIDRSFVLAMEAGQRDAQAIVQAVVDLAHTLHLEAVAEGVENQAMMDRLAGLGCDFVQGFHVCRPLPGPDLERWFSRVQGRWPGWVA